MPTKYVGKWFEIKNYRTTFKEPFSRISVKKNMMKHNHQNKFESFLKNSEWIQLRNQLGTLYMSKLYFNEYNKNSDFDIISEIKEFENFFMKFGINGYSRCFLLGFYIKIHNFGLELSQNENSNQIRMNPNITNLLDKSRMKIVKIDYLIIFLNLLLDIVKVDKVEEWINSNESFNSIYRRISESSQQYIHNNLLAYSASINEPDFFIYDKV